MVGEDWFRAAAALFAREAPPSSAALADYGEDFPTWLDRFPPAHDLPYLAGVAHLDRLWTETLFAAEAAPLEPDAFAALPLEDLAQARVVLHPSSASPPSTPACPACGRRRAAARTPWTCRKIRRACC
jgi:hypothetical protein